MFNNSHYWQTVLLGIVIGMLIWALAYNCFPSRRKNELLVSTREHATILAALTWWRNNITDFQQRVLYMRYQSKDLAPLNKEEIIALCERVNEADRPDVALWGGAMDDLPLQSKKPAN
jgi:hypothetical protein